MMMLLAGADDSFDMLTCMQIYLLSRMPEKQLDSPAIISIEKVIASHDTKIHQC